MSSTTSQPRASAGRRGHLPPLLQPAASGQRATARLLRAAPRWLFLLPAVAYLGALFAYPIIYNVLLSVRQSSVVGFVRGTSSFVGLTNYRAAFTNPVLPGVVVNTLVFMAGSLVAQFGLGFLLALFFFQRFPLSGLLRSLILVPWLLPGVVTGLVLRLMVRPR